MRQAQTFRKRTEIPPSWKKKKTKAPWKKQKTSDNYNNQYLRCKGDNTFFLHRFPPLTFSSCCNLIISSNRDWRDFRWGPGWGLGMGVYVGPCFQGREPSRGSAFLTQSTTKGMWTIWTKTSATMVLHRPVHVVGRPASALTLLAFSIPPPDAGDMERDIHRLRYGPSITSTVCAMVPFLPVQPNVNIFWGPRHCVDVENAA